MILGIWQLSVVFFTAVYIFSNKFLSWTQFQGIVMLVQNRYQRRRMYTRIALGKDSIMDVVTGESSGARGQLLLLYPMLFGKLHTWQLHDMRIISEWWQVHKDPYSAYASLKILFSILCSCIHPRLTWEILSCSASVLAGVHRPWSTPDHSGSCAASWRVGWFRPNWFGSPRPEGCFWGRCCVCDNGHF